MSINVGGGELRELKPRILVIGVGVNTINLRFTTTNSSDREVVSGTWKNVGGSIATGDGGLWQRIS